MKLPWRLYITQDEGGLFIVSDKVVNRHGVGETLPAAMIDYWDTVLEYWGWLREDPAMLAGPCPAHLQRLNEAFG